MDINTIDRVTARSEAYNKAIVIAAIGWSIAMVVDAFKKNHG